MKESGSQVYLYAKTVRDGRETNEKDINPDLCFNVMLLWWISKQSGQLGGLSSQCCHGADARQAIQQSATTIRTF